MAGLGILKAHNLLRKDIAKLRSEGLTKAQISAKLRAKYKEEYKETPQWLQILLELLPIILKLFFPILLVTLLSLPAINLFAA